MIVRMLTGSVFHFITMIFWIIMTVRYTVEREPSEFLVVMLVLNVLLSLLNIILRSK